MQAGGGVGGGDRQGLAHQHVAGVQPGIHLHDGDAAGGIARFDGAVDGGGPAPARQQRGVDVHAAQPWQIQHPLRQDEPVGGHHHHIGAGSQQSLAGCFGIFRVFAIQAQAAWLGHGDVVRQGALLHGRGLQLHAAPGGPVGLRQHQHHIKARCVQLLQCHAGKFGRACKHHPHACGRGHQRRPPDSAWWRSSSFCSFTSLVLMRLRLSGDRYSTNTLPIR